jgi:exodeoxyribonuclease VII small subunit
MDTENNSYSGMMKELEGILAQIGKQDIDVDVLIEKVKRAAILIALCKAKLKGSEQEIAYIINSMDNGPCPDDINNFN